MFHFITGEAGTGKSTLILEMINEISDNAEIIAIVPDQFSYEFERNLYNALGIKRFNTAKISVFGFNKLTDAVFEEGVFPHKKYASDEIKSILMYKALKNLSGNKLRYFNKQHSKPAFRKKALEMIKELSDNHITAEECTNRFAVDISSDNTSDSSLTLKMNDIAMIMTEYINVLTASGYRDDVNIYFEAAKLAENTNFFKKKTVFIDGFSGFTAGENQIIEEMIKSADDVFLTLTIDNYSGDNFTKFSLFSPTEYTKSSLISICKKHEIDYESRYFSRPYRYENEAIKCFSKNVLRLSSTTFIGQNDAVKVIECEDIYDEAKNCAAIIHQMCVTEKSYRFSDIVIAAHDVKMYGDVLKGVFSRYNIPLFVNEKIPLSHQSITVFVMSFLRISCLKNPSADDYLRLIKTGFLRYKDKNGDIVTISDDDVYDFDEFCYINDIKGHHFKNEFDDLRFEKIRKIVLKNAEKFAENSTGKDGKTICENLAQTLSQFEIPERLASNSEHGLCELISQREQIGAWNIICTIIEQIHECLSSDEIVSLTEFYEFVETAFREQFISSPPQTIDSITLVPTASSRLNNPKCIIVLGVNEDVIPSAPVRNSLLSDTDLVLLREKNVNISGDIITKIAEERFAVYNICAGAKEKILLLYSAASSDGKSLQPSEIIDNAVGIFGNDVLIKSSQFPQTFFCRNSEISYVEYIEKRLYDWKFAVSLRSALETVNEYKSRLEKAQLSKNISPENAEKLYENSLNLSATSFENYCKCPFLFFVKKGLNLTTRKRIELTSLIKGNVVHFVLSKITEDIIVNRLSVDNATEIYKSADKYLLEFYNNESEIGSKIYKSAKFIAEYKKIKGTIYAVLKHIISEFSSSEFKPSDAEFHFGFSANYKLDEPPYKIFLENGKTVKFSGSVDRVDVYENYVRITDYKTGKKDFDYQKMLNGIDLQPLIYIFAITDRNAKKYKDFYPAGTLYLFTYDPAPKEDLRQNMSENEFALRRPIGAVIDDEAIISAMEDIPDGASGNFIPVRFCAFDKKSGVRKIDKTKSSVLSMNEFDLLKTHFLGLVENAANDIYNGVCEPLPIAKRDYNGTEQKDEYVPCSYCDYASVCGNYPPLKNFRNFTASDKKTAKEMLFKIDVDEDVE
ncbi:MAG: PD-(D/E)XK nuclease family protein [Ruminococcus sp.]|jgi:ATP-dependent helicase/nuclease subunit B|nr:PD-(D/E)XK nuclease family protein [Ruminococcus sp.]